MVQLASGWPLRVVADPPNPASRKGWDEIWRYDSFARGVSIVEDAMNPCAAKEVDVAVKAAEIAAEAVATDELVMSVMDTEAPVATVAAKEAEGSEMGEIETFAVALGDSFTAVDALSFVASAACLPGDEYETV